MPLSLFGSKFSPKKGGPRRSASLSNLNLEAPEHQQAFGIELGPVKLNLGGNEISFTDGQWISESNGGAAGPKELVRSRKEGHHLREENNLLKVKIDLLLDLLSERTAEVHLQENEIEQLKKLAKRR